MKTLLNTPTAAWLALMVLTLSGFISAEFGTMKAVSIAAVMALSAIKARIVLYRFMELEALPFPIKMFFNIWLFACAIMIFSLFVLAL